MPEKSRRAGAVLPVSGLAERKTPYRARVRSLVSIIPEMGPSDVMFTLVPLRVPPSAPWNEPPCDVFGLTVPATVEKVSVRPVPAVRPTTNGAVALLSTLPFVLAAEEKTLAVPLTENAPVWSWAEAGREKARTAIAAGAVKAIRLTERIVETFLSSISKEIGWSSLNGTSKPSWHALCPASLHPSVSTDIIVRIYSHRTECVKPLREKSDCDLV